MTSPGNAEKSHGKHPTQKPVALVQRCILASTNPGDLILDPFLGGGTTAVACIRLRRNFVGIELDLTHLTLATRRADAEIILLWLRHFRVKVGISIVAINCVMPPDTTPSPRGEGRGEGPCQGWGEGERSPRGPDISPSDGPARMPSLAGAGEGGANAPGEGGRGKIKHVREGELSPRVPNISHEFPPKNDLDLFSNLIDRSAPMSDKPEPQADRIFHETKFVFLSCAVVTSASVVHTTVDVSLHEAWAKTPDGKRRETTHIVRCETEIFRLKSS